MPADEKAKILEKRRKLDARLKALEEKEQERQSRKERLAGAAALTLCQNNPGFRHALRDILDKTLSGKRDRALFDLPPSPEPATREAAEPPPGPTHGA